MMNFELIYFQKLHLIFQGCIISETVPTMLDGNGKKELKHIKGSTILNIVSHLFSTNICSSSSHHEGFCKFEIELRFTLVILKT